MFKRTVHLHGRLPQNCFQIIGNSHAEANWASCRMVRKELFAFARFESSFSTWVFCDPEQLFPQSWNRCRVFSLPLTKCSLCQVLAPVIQIQRISIVLVLRHQSLLSEERPLACGWVWFNQHLQSFWIVEELWFKVTEFLFFPFRGWDICEVFRHVDTPGGPSCS